MVVVVGHVCGSGGSHVWQPRVNKRVMCAVNQASRESRHVCSRIESSGRHACGTKDGGGAGVGGGATESIPLANLNRELKRVCMRMIGNATRNSAQGNCSAKSLAGNVVDSSLSSLSSTSHANISSSSPSSSANRRGVQPQGGPGWGAGDISSTLPCSALPHGACPKGTSHNEHRPAPWGSRGVSPGPDTEDLNQSRSAGRAAER